MPDKALVQTIPTPRTYSEVLSFHDKDNIDPLNDKNFLNSLRRCIASGIYDSS